MLVREVPRDLLHAHHLEPCVSSFIGAAGFGRRGTVACHGLPEQAERGRGHDQLHEAAICALPHSLKSGQRLLTTGAQVHRRGQEAASGLAVDQFNEGPSKPLCFLSATLEALPGRPPGSTKAESSMEPSVTATPRNGQREEHTAHHVRSHWQPSGARWPLGHQNWRRATRICKAGLQKLLQCEVGIEGREQPTPVLPQRLRNSRAHAVQQTSREPGRQERLRSEAAIAALHTVVAHDDKCSVLSAGRMQPVMDPGCKVRVVAHQLFRPRAVSAVEVHVREARQALVRIKPPRRVVQELTVAAEHLCRAVFRAICQSWCIGVKVAVCRIRHIQGRPRARIIGA
mmetsp:Transcript_55927/g.179509  ORF Transcript_55927/g.179509 Transcript_55927/m.179509 type:complete len:343 (-) Transcript_55927:862-1890(-)